MDALLRKTATALSLLSLMGMGAASADQVFGVHLPDGYLGRFSSIEAVVSNTDGYGVRYLPLPLDPDIRITLLKTPTYWDYGLTANYAGISMGAGVFYNVGKVYAQHDPWTGWQWGVYTELPDLLRPNSGTAPFSKAYVGYAFAQDAARVMSNFGVAALKTPRNGDTWIVGPYWQVVGSYDKGKDLDPSVNVGINVTGRFYAYPLQGQAQGSLDITPRLQLRPLPGFTVDVSHLERFVQGEVQMGDSYARYQESNATLTYRLKYATDPAFNLGALRARVTRNWTGDYTYVRGDVFFRSNALPVMVGPSIGYQFGPNGADSYFLWSLVTLWK